MSKKNSYFKQLNIGVTCYTAIITGTDTLLDLLGPKVGETTPLFNI